MNILLFLVYVYLINVYLYFMDKDESLFMYFIPFFWFFLGLYYSILEIYLDLKKLFTKFVLNKK